MEPMDLKDGNGLVVGNSTLWFIAEYLIGNEIKKIKVPIYWELNVKPNRCHNISGQPFGCDELLPMDFNNHKLAQKLLGHPGWEPGQVGTLFIFGENSPNINFYDRIDAFYAGKKELLNKFIKDGSSEIGVILPNTVKKMCLARDMTRNPDSCQQDGDKVIIPGYK